MKMESMLPLSMLPGCKAKGVSTASRISNLLFGAPSARRANGIISTRFDMAGMLYSVLSRAGATPKAVPVFEIDRKGGKYSEKLPRIWLSEEIANTSYTGRQRVFVECYPTGRDPGGWRALELADRYMGEGLMHPGRTECFQAAEILYLHAVQRGNREAARSLRRIYESDLCDGNYWKPYIVERAKHARHCNLGKGCLESPDQSL